MEEEEEEEEEETEEEEEDEIKEGDSPLLIIYCTDGVTTSMPVIQRRLTQDRCNREMRRKKGEDSR